MKRANEWTLAQLTAMGCSNAHLEDWGEFGMGWQQRNTWIRMVSPDTLDFTSRKLHLGHAGPERRDHCVGGCSERQEKKKISINTKGKLKGKIVLFGELVFPSQPTAPLFTRYDDKGTGHGIFRYAWTDDDLGRQHVLPLDAMEEAFNKQIALREKIAKISG